MMKRKSSEGRKQKMLKPRTGQGSFLDADYICEQLIPPDSFYRKPGRVGTAHHKNRPQMTNAEL
jgi:hypothetical protein